ncbi:hypothetical protein [Streptomyces hundungensis]|uniref:hypothetical protein n=1 Tax=Streptomyces hundungensis TaxID=1077946 RepID=UPI0034087CE9
MADNFDMKAEPGTRTLARSDIHPYWDGAATCTVVALARAGSDSQLERVTRTLDDEQVGPSEGLRSVRPLPDKSRGIGRWVVATAGSRCASRHDPAVMR